MQAFPADYVWDLMSQENIEHLKLLVTAKQKMLELPTGGKFKALTDEVRAF